MVEAIFGNLFREVWLGDLAIRLVTQMLTFVSTRVGIRSNFREALSRFGVNVFIDNRRRSSSAMSMSEPRQERFASSLVKACAKNADGLTIDCGAEVSVLSSETNQNRAFLQTFANVLTAYMNSLNVLRVRALKYEPQQSFFFEDSREDICTLCGLELKSSAKFLGEPWSTDFGEVSGKLRKFLGVEICLHMESAEAPISVPLEVAWVQLANCSHCALEAAWLTSCG